MKSVSFRFMFVLLISLFVSGCASLDSIPKAPKLSVLKVAPTEMGFKEQTFRFTLNIFNPNAFKLPVQKIQLGARFSGIEVGEGLTSEPIELAANGNTEIAMDIKTDLSKVVSNFTDLFKNKGLNLDYELTGKMLLLNTGIGEGLGIPFKLNGNLLERN